MGSDGELAAPAVALGLTVWGMFAVARARAVERRAAIPWCELAGCGVLAAAAPLLAAGTEDAAARGIACIALLSAAGADARTGHLFDAVTFPAALLTATVAILGGEGARAAGGVLLLVGIFGSLVVLSRGRLMGLGDVKAMYALGAAFGPVEGALAVAAASACGVAVAYARGTRGRGTEIPFGPHLAAGAAFALVFGDPLAQRLAGGAS
jgi:prepilin signal peptidase PulO-like enzyme (type II secretory pathway)